MISEILFNRLNGTTRRIRESHDDGINLPHIISGDYLLAVDANALLAQHAIELTERLEIQEGETASEEDAGIVEGDFDNINLKALIYLRNAFSTVDPYDAYIKYNQFNNYRILKGWSLTQVVAGLADVGLSQEEWDLILARYNYLVNPLRVAAMQDYQTIRNGDNF